MQVKTIALAAALSVVPGLVQAQFDFKLAGRDVQIHSFASQGFGYSNENNYLTMKTSKGSFAMTDGGVNISTQLTDRLRIGAQIYLRNVGKLGDWHPVLDWAFADYKFKDWFGLRGGKVKTTLGLFNDSQDNEFLHTWALLPQSVYPLDLRGSTIAHNGGDAYGRIPLQRLGHLDYTAYGGARSVDQHEGWAVVIAGVARCEVDVAASVHLKRAFGVQPLKLSDQVSGFHSTRSLLRQTSATVR